MSFTLLKTVFKKNWLLLFIFFAVLTMYMAVMISIYEPNDLQALTSILKLMPADLMRAMGFDKVINDLTGYLASWLYGLLMFGFPMVYCIILGNRLVAKMVDNSSFAYLLSTPNSRTKIIVTQGVYALASIMLLFAAVFGVGVLFSAIMFPGALDIGGFIRVNLTTMLVNMVVMMISFFFSCLFNDTKQSLGFGSGVPIAFLLMNMLGNTSAEVEVLKKISIYGFYDPVNLAHGSSSLRVNLVYLGLIVILFVSSVLVFRRKRLPL